MNSDTQSIVVKPPELKFDLFHIPLELYKKFSVQSDFQYTREENETEVAEHDKWLESIYYSMDSVRKSQLNHIHAYLRLPYEISWNTKNLPDQSTIEDLIIFLKSINLSRPISNELLVDFYKYFYDNYLQDEYNKQKIILESRSKQLNDSMDKMDFNIYDFMEKYSGMKFQERKKVEFYFITCTLGGQLWRTENSYISTIKLNGNYKNEFLSTPFHEFSHILFNQIDNDKVFLNLCDSMKSVSMGYILDNMVIDKEILSELRNIDSLRALTLYQTWNEQDVYTWNERCEENLVEGFAKYLEYKFYGKSDFEQNYKYDLAFYKYLKQNEIDNSNANIDNFLKECSINFLRQITTANN